MADKILGLPVREGTVRDVLQVVVGSFTGALVFIKSSELRRISDCIPSPNLCLVVATSVFFSYAVSYLIGTSKRQLGRRDLLLGLVPGWSLIQYLSSVIFSLILLYLLGINTVFTPNMTVVK